MKNIFIIPTTEDSNIVSDKKNDNLFFTTSKNIPLENQFVYITNNEEPKINDYWVDKEGVLQKTNFDLEYGNKVILTNNPNLKNVQQLTEEELQLLVDNFSDSVEVDSVYKQQLNCCKEVCEFKQCHSFFECKYVDEDDLSKIYSLVFSPKKK